MKVQGLGLGSFRQCLDTIRDKWAKSVYFRFSQFGYGKVKLGLNYKNCHNVLTFLLGTKMCFFVFTVESCLDHPWWHMVVRGESQTNVNCVHSLIPPISLTCSTERQTCFEILDDISFPLLNM